MKAQPDLAERSIFMISLSPFTDGTAKEQRFRKELNTTGGVRE